MRKNSASQSGVFNPRMLLAFTFCSVGILLAMFSFAAAPGSATASTSSAEATAVTAGGSHTCALTSAGGSSAGAPTATASSATGRGSTVRSRSFRFPVSQAASPPSPQLAAPTPARSRAQAGSSAGDTTTTASSVTGRRAPDSLRSTSPGLQAASQPSPRASTRPVRSRAEAGSSAGALTTTVSSATGRRRTA